MLYYAHLKHLWYLYVKETALPKGFISEIVSQLPDDGQRIGQNKS